MGLLFSILFLRKGVGKIDPVAHEGSIGFKIMILPGVIMLWPYLAKRWLSGRNEPLIECNAHRHAACPCQDNVQKESS